MIGGKDNFQIKSIRILNLIGLIILIPFTLIEGIVHLGMMFLFFIYIWIFVILLIFEIILIIRRKTNIIKCLTSSWLTFLSVISIFYVFYLFWKFDILKNAGIVQ